MFKRKLTALGYQDGEKFNVAKHKDLSLLMVWLEDQKIRHYPIEARAELKNTESPEQWSKAFQKYIIDTSCPITYSPETVNQVVEWFLGYAIRLEYADAAQDYNKFTSEAVQRNAVNAPKMVSANPLDNLDFDGAEFKAGVDKLAELLHITRHPDHLITLHAISKLVRTRYNADAIKDPSSVIPEGKPFPFQDIDFGFDTGDYILNQALKILRLLYIHDLRDLQTTANQCIVQVQNITANPKTDTKLGKVGY